jgi:hypothetical protein
MRIQIVCRLSPKSLNLHIKCNRQLPERSERRCRKIDMSANRMLPESDKLKCSKGRAAMFERPCLSKQKENDKPRGESVT